MRFQLRTGDLAGRLRRIGARLGGFGRFVARRFVEDECPQVGAALAYTSLLSLVPLMAVTLSMLAAFPVFERLGEELQDFVFSNFVPASGAVIQSYLQGFAQKASRLTVVGIAVLIFTALLLMATIDKSLNAIWRSRGQRSLVSRFMVYWAVLTLGPVLVGLGLVATSYLATMTLHTVSGVGAEAGALRLLPFLSTAVAFTLLYVLVPSRRVPLGPAVVGGLVAALLFESAKRSFAWYVTHVPTYEAIYGTLASIPIFLIWIYLSWVIILLGAEVAHSLVIYRTGEGGSEHRSGGQRFVLTLRLAGHLARAQRSGEACAERRLLELEPRFDEESITDVLEDLRRARYVERSESGDWLLTRDPAAVSILGLYRAAPGPLPPCSEAAGPSARDPLHRVIDQVLAEVDEGLERAMAVTLRELTRRAEASETRLELDAGQPLPARADRLAGVAAGVSSVHEPS